MVCRCSEGSNLVTSYGMGVIERKAEEEGGGIIPS